MTQKTKPKRALDRRCRLALLLACLPFCWGHAQQSISLDIPRVVPVSPEAAMMEKFQSYPIDLCTGVPEVTIPLYNIETGELTIPVTLSYHASGLKPKERSGLAGTGWTLNLDPSISRQINGVRDEDRYGWFNRFDSWNTVPVGQQAQYEYYTKKLDNTYDTYPDKFTYKLPNGGSSGYFDNQFSPLRTAPRTNDKVVFDGANYIEITDAEGIRYRFGGEYEKTGNDITRWLCEGIYSPRSGGALATFSYDTQLFLSNPNEFYNLNDQLIFVSRDDNDDEVIMIDQNNGNYYELTANSSGENAEPHRRVILPSETETNYTPSPHYLPGEVTLSRLQEVRFKGNKLNVYYGATGEVPNNSDVYDRIEVRNEDGELVRLIKFHITPYNDNTSLTKLDSVVISAPGTKDRIYRFAYYDSYAVPSIYTTNVDHWGFCNGPEGSEQHTIPSIRQKVKLDWNGMNNPVWQTVHYEGISREPNATATRYGVLWEVTDPLGARTRFTYEGNAAAFRDNSKDKSRRDYLHPVGGLRVSQTEVYDPRSGRRTRRLYRYGLTREKDRTYEPIWGGGAVKHLVTQRDYYSEMEVYAHDPYNLFDWQEHAAVYHSMPVSDISFNGGSAVMYNVVEESVRGEGGDYPQYKNMYYYDVRAHDFEDALTWSDSDPHGSVMELLAEGDSEEIASLLRPEPYSYPEPSDDFGQGGSDQMNGALLMTDHYLGGRLQESRENVYERHHFWASETEFTVPERKMIISLDDFLENNYEGDVFTTRSYIADVYSVRSLKAEVTTRYFTDEGDDTLRVRKDYGYGYVFSDPHSPLSPTRMETLTGDGRLSADDYEYLDGYPGVLSMHRHVEEEDTVESRILFRENTPLPERVQSRAGSAPYRDEVVYTAYDGNGNPTEIRGKDGTPVSFIWSYRNRFPIAKIENASIGEIHAALGDSDLDDLASVAKPDAAAVSSINELRTLLPSARVTTYLYEPLNGVTEITDPNGTVSKFEYDSRSRLTESSYMDGTMKAVLGKWVYNW